MKTLEKIIHALGRLFRLSPSDDDLLAQGDKILIVAPCELAYEQETHMDSNAPVANLRQLCTLFHLLPDNEHEGKGWWEKVWTVCHKGFSPIECTHLMHFDQKARRYFTYLPREVLKDLDHHHRIGFKLQIDGRINDEAGVVWIESRENNQEAS